MNISQYNSTYPYLAYFNNPDFSTYTRRSKTGKLVLVRKGKRKSNAMRNLAIGAGVLGVGVAAVIAGRKISNLNYDNKNLKASLDHLSSTAKDLRYDNARKAARNQGLNQHITKLASKIDDLSAPKPHQGIKLKPQ